MKLKQVAEHIGKSVPVVMAIQRKYGLRTFPDYSNGYAALLRNVIQLSVFFVPVKDIKALLQHERALLELLKVDSIQNTPDWFEAGCTTKTGPKRLLLSGYDIGHALTGERIQTGLDFKARATELFDDREMGADVLKGLKRYLSTADRVRAKLTTELPLVRNAVKWCSRVT